MQDPKTPKMRHLGTIAQRCRAISSQQRHISTIRKILLNSNVSPTCPHNMVYFGPLAAEICWRVCCTQAHFNGFRVLAALLHGTLVVGVSQTLRRWTEGATYIRQGGHHVGHWPTFLVARYLTNTNFRFLLEARVRTVSVLRDWQQHFYDHYGAFTFSSTGVYSQHPQLRTGGFCWSKVLLPACPCWRQLYSAFWLGEKMQFFLKAVRCTISTPLAY